MRPIYHGHCEGCGARIPMDNTHCGSCSKLWERGISPPDVEIYRVDVTDAFADLLPEMEYDLEHPF